MTSFLKNLEAKGKPVIDIILEHPIIASLCPTNVSSTTKILSKEELIAARNNFYIQDYLFLILGYELSRNVLLISFGDKSREQDIEYIRKNLGLDGIRNPIEGSSVKTLENEIKKIPLSFDTKSINLATKEYILFKTNKSLEGSYEAIIVSFACIFTYYKIWEKFYINQDQIRKDQDLRKWIRIFFNQYAKEYYENYTKVINYISPKIENKNKRYLVNIFLQACNFEYLFFEELLSD